MKSNSNETKGKTFTVLGRSGPEAARALIAKSSSLGRGARNKTRKKAKR